MTAIQFTFQSFPLEARQIQGTQPLHKCHLNILVNQYLFGTESFQTGCSAQGATLQV